MDPFYLQLQKDCAEIATQAGKLLCSHQDNFTIVQMKDDVDLATSADIDSEKLIISLVRQKYPNHAILSEEAGAIGGSSEYQWIIDPLDGTKEYVRGLKTYNVLLAVEYQQALIAGAIYTNGPNELYASSKGNGAYLDGKPIHVSTTGSLRTSLVGFHLPIGTAPKASIERSLVILRELISATYRVRPTWYDANFLGLVSRGIIDAHIIPPDTKNKWEDDASGILLVMEAGGKVTDWKGNAIKNHDLSGGLLASNGHLHDDLVGLLKT